MPPVGRGRAPTRTGCAPRATPRSPSGATCGPPPSPAASTAGAPSSSATAACPGPTCWPRPAAWPRSGFPASPLLSFMLHDLDGVEGCDELATVRPDVGEPGACAPTWPASWPRWPSGVGPASTRASSGPALREVGAGEFVEADLARPGAAGSIPSERGCGATTCGPCPRCRRATSPWPVPASSSASPARPSGLRMTRPGPTSSSRPVGWPGRTGPRCSTTAPTGRALLDAGRLDAAAARFDPSRPSGAAGPTRDGGTIHLAVVDADGMGVSLIQSNAADFGCRVAVPGTGILLHNRASGSPSRRVTRPSTGPAGGRPTPSPPPWSPDPTAASGSCSAPWAATPSPRSCSSSSPGSSPARPAPGDALDAPRFVLGTDSTQSFDTWRATRQVVRLEAHAPPAWVTGLEDRGHLVEVAGLRPGRVRPRPRDRGAARRHPGRRLRRARP